MNDNNYAFIDTQNILLGIKSLGWEMDWHRFRVYLRDKYKVTKALLFLGYIPSLIENYIHLIKCGYEIIFRPVSISGGKVKGNCDADLVLYAATHWYDQAVLVTNDGDFYSLTKHLRQRNKLRTVLSVSRGMSSSILRSEAGMLISFLDDVRNKIEKRKSVE